VRPIVILKIKMIAENNPKYPYHRKSTRLAGYDYSQDGVYFITLVTHIRAPIFGMIMGGEIVLSELGKIVKDEWYKTGQIRSEIILDEFVVMPDHLHGILAIENSSNGARPCVITTESNSPMPPRKPQSLGSFIAGFKSSVTKQINLMRCTPGQPVWQRNYYDRVIRNDRELDAIRLYIQANPQNWAENKENRPFGKK
jgi:putative transposase